MFKDDRYKEAMPIVNVSGGKDSTALCLHLMENGFTQNDFIRVFADTGWEHQHTYDHLDELEKTIGKIHRVKKDLLVKPENVEKVREIEEMLGFESPMARQILNNNFFSNSFAKWCTRILKIEPVKEFIGEMQDEYGEVINLVGIRAEESAKRSTFTEWEYIEGFDCWTHRPLLTWTFEDVIAIHQRFGLTPNHLYLNGYNRVGCYPCINTSKKEIMLLSDERVAVIRKLEEFANEGKKEGDKVAAFFRSKKAKIPFMRIDDVMNWARGEEHGLLGFLQQFSDQDLDLFVDDDPSCVRWGMCNIEAPLK